MSYSKGTIIGRLGKEPEMRYTPDGKAVTSFSVAVGRKVGEKEETDWFRVTCWGKLAEIANQYLVKGQQVYVEGRLSLKTWEGKDGVSHSGMEIVANELVMLDKPKVGG